MTETERWAAAMRRAGLSDSVIEVVTEWAEPEE